jgi:hypothetical protein
MRSAPSIFPFLQNFICYVLHEYESPFSALIRRVGSQHLVSRNRKSGYWHLL